MKSSGTVLHNKTHLKNLTNNVIYYLFKYLTLQDLINFLNTDRSYSKLSVAQIGVEAFRGTGIFSLQSIPQSQGIQSDFTQLNTLLSEMHIPSATPVIKIPALLLQCDTKKLEEKKSGNSPKNEIAQPLLHILLYINKNKAMVPGYYFSLFEMMAYIGRDPHKLMQLVSIFKANFNRERLEIFSLFDQIVEMRQAALVPVQRILAIALFYYYENTIPLTGYKTSRFYIFWSWYLLIQSKDVFLSMLENFETVKIIRFFLIANIYIFLGNFFSTNYDIEHDDFKKFASKNEDCKQKMDNIFAILKQEHKEPLRTVKSLIKEVIDFAKLYLNSQKNTHDKKEMQRKLSRFEKGQFPWLGIPYPEPCIYDRNYNGSLYVCYKGLRDRMSAVGEFFPENLRIQFEKKDEQFILDCKNKFASRLFNGKANQSEPSHPSGAAPSKFFNRRGHARLGQPFSPPKGQGSGPSP